SAFALVGLCLFDLVLSSAALQCQTANVLLLIFRLLLFQVSLNMNQKRKSSSLRRLFTFVFLLAVVFLIGNAFITVDYKQGSISGWSSIVRLNLGKLKMCKTQLRPLGSETLPRGIVASTSDLEMRPLWGAKRNKDEQETQDFELLLSSAALQCQTANVLLLIFSLLLFQVSLNMNQKRKSSSLRRLFTFVFLLAVVFLIGNAFITVDYKQGSISGWSSIVRLNLGKLKMCKTQLRPLGSKTLPRGIVASTSDLEMRPLWGAKRNKNPKQNLLAMAVGIKQKESVNKILKKFSSSEFVVMLFHYDGTVDEWKEFEWSETAIHVSVVNQTKWWFAKRFLHPDIVSAYSYIFLWDEDLGVDHFDAKR
ncbi:hypothetical protein F2Q68_00026673, partial [Brassica cretica]